MTNVREVEVGDLSGSSLMPAYLIALVQEGGAEFLDNAAVTVRALAVDDVVVPLVFGEPRVANGDVCSPSAHYLRYTFEEFEKRHPRIPSWCLRALSVVATTMFLAGNIDRVVYVNNWLFATNPYQPLSPEQLEAVKRHVTQRYPQHAVVVRTVNPYLQPQQSEQLRSAGFTLVKARRVYLLDPAGEPFSKSDNAQRDLRLLRTSPYAIIGNAQLDASDMDRLEQLYRSLYLDKHSLLNPQYTRRFFELLWRENLATFRALKRDGRIDGFICFWVQDNLLVGVCIGYDVAMPREAGLYRQLIALLITEAGVRGVVLHLSAGVGHFKALRGALPFAEYDAVYVRHLASHRQLAWRLLQGQGNLW